MLFKTKLRKGDNVQVLNGKDKGQTGAIISIFLKTKNSVDPKPISPFLPEYLAIFPFSRQGVILANKVSFFLNFAPPLNDFNIIPETNFLPGLTSSIITQGYTSPLSIETEGFISTNSSNNIITSIIPEYS